MLSHTPITLISGGQTGVDRAVLDFALSRHIPCGGWCTNGRKAEDGPIPKRYPLKELNSPHYSDRTKRNVADSDATLVLFDQAMDNGTQLTIDFIIELNKPYRIHSVNQNPLVLSIHDWLIQNHIYILNVAGPRESSEKGIYKKCIIFLEILFPYQEKEESKNELNKNL